MSVYHEGGVLDRGSTLDAAKGAVDIAAFTQRPEHDEAIRSGFAHLHHEAEPRDLPNHGVSTVYQR